MNPSLLLQKIANLLLGWPLIAYVIGVSVICTVACGFVQLRYFFKAWKFTLFPERSEKKETKGKVDMSPFQAFVNALSTSLGNGSVAGMATALHLGGPGAAFWLLVTAFVTMAVRFAEVFLSAYVGARVKTKATIGGPMLYLKRVIGGKSLAYIYAFFAFLFGLTGGNAIQTNSIRVSIETTWQVSHIAIAIGVLLFMMYLLFGGASRIVKVSDGIVPIKVGVFFVSAIVVLGYHYQALWPALKIIFNSAFSSAAVTGGVAGFAIQQAVRRGMMSGIFATESGLGTSAILFGSTGSTQPVRTGIMSMLVTFISSLVCFMISLCIVASGVLSTGLDSTALTIASYNTVFGQWGGWVVTFLSVSFGIGVLVTYAYITREAWAFLTGGRFAWMHTVLYSGVAFGGVLMNVRAVWDLSDIVMAGMLLINLFGILWLLPLIRREFKAFAQKH
ncbi:alanine/glycine:cation symporter family protein [Candidatus Dependentiae bacterium]